MVKSYSIRWAAMMAGVAMLLVLAVACGETKTIEVPGETVIVEKEVVKTIEVPGETVTVTKEVVKEVEVPGDTKVVEKVRTVVEQVQVPGETVVVEKEVIKTVEVAGAERVVTKEVEVVGERYARNIWGELVEKPQYGGSISISYPNEPSNFDPYWDCFGSCRINGALTYEKLGVIDWAVPRDEFDMTTGYPNIDYATGNLAESWEQPDPLTIIFHIRPGVHWHDKAPLNGRELTAKDVEFSWHRIMGLGSGYDEKAPGMYFDLPVVSVTATDDWTVEVKSSEFSFDTIRQLTISTQMYHTVHAAPEVIEQHGDVADWKNIVGTGPYVFADYADGDSITYERNNNYWGYDPLHPNNRLPYPDEVKILFLPEVATQVAALRSGKIDLIAGGLPYSQIESIQKTNPELVLRSYTGPEAQNVGFNMEVKPFDDINVRIAMQKALNNDLIVREYYLGRADPTPWGVANAASGLNVPFAQWPEEVRWMYEYDPAAAEKLLDDAGLPRGDNGIRFERSLDMCWLDDIDALILYASYWEEVGIKVNLELPTDESDCWPRMSTRQADGFFGFQMHKHDSRHKPLDPLTAIAGRYHSTKGWVGENVFGVSDPVYDALVDTAQSSQDWEEYKKLVKEVDAYHVAQMWSLYGPPVVDGNLLHSPWLGGYRAENAASWDVYTNSVPYMWVNQQLKDSMGR